MTNSSIYVYINYHTVTTPGCCTTFVVHSCANLIDSLIFFVLIYLITKPDIKVSPAPDTSFTETYSTGNTSSLYLHPLEPNVTINLLLLGFPL